MPFREFLNYLIVHIKLHIPFAPFAFVALAVHIQQSALSVTRPTEQTYKQTNKRKTRRQHWSHDKNRQQSPFEVTRVCGAATEQRLTPAMVHIKLPLTCRRADIQT